LQAQLNLGYIDYVSLGGSVDTMASDAEPVQGPPPVPPVGEGPQGPHFMYEKNV